MSASKHRVVSIARGALQAVEGKPDHEARGAHDLVRDLSVGRDERMALIRSGYSAIVKFELANEMIALHENLLIFIENKLANRLPTARVMDGCLRVDFQVRDMSIQSMTEIGVFCDDIEALLGDTVVGVHGKVVDIGDFEIVIDRKGRYRPALKAL